MSRSEAVAACMACGVAIPTSIYLHLQAGPSTRCARGCRTSCGRCDELSSEQSTRWAGARAGRTRGVSQTDAGTMASEVQALVNYYARTRYPRHIQTVCTEVLKKRTNEPVLMFWRAYGLVMEGSYSEVTSHRCASSLSSHAWGQLHGAGQPRRHAAIRFSVGGSRLAQHGYYIACTHRQLRPPPQ
jgi:hypothetical protein